MFFEESYEIAGFFLADTVGFRKLQNMPNRGDGNL